MEYGKWIYGLGTCLIITGAIMKILHLPYANVILQVGILGTLFFQTWYVTKLKERIKELESKTTQ